MVLGDAFDVHDTDVFNLVRDLGTPERVLLELAHDESVIVRTLLAERAELPESVVRVLCRDEDEEVIKTVLQDSAGTTIPGDVLLELAHHKGMNVRIAVACYPGLSDGVVAVLLNDDERLVLEYVAERCDIPEYAVKWFIDSYSSGMWQSLMMNVKFFPVDAVEELWRLNQRTKNYEDVNRFAVIRLCRDKRTPVRLFEELAQLRMGATYLPDNQSCPVHVIERLTLLEGLHPEVRRKIASRLVDGSPQWEGMPVEWVVSAAFKE